MRIVKKRYVTVGGMCMAAARSAAPCARHRKRLCHRRVHVHGRGTACRAVCMTFQKQCVVVVSHLSHPVSYLPKTLRIFHTGRRDEYHPVMKYEC